MQLPSYLVLHYLAHPVQKDHRQSASLRGTLVLGVGTDFNLLVSPQYMYLLL